MVDGLRTWRGRSPAWGTAATLCLAVVLAVSGCSGSEDDSATAASSTASSTTVGSGPTPSSPSPSNPTPSGSGTAGSGTAGPLPDCAPFGDAAGLLADPATAVTATSSVTQGLLTFVALRVDGVADPVVVVRVADGEWQALDEGSAAATGAPLDDSADPTASRASLGAQKAVDCVGGG